MMSNMISKNIRAPYMEIDELGRCWMDINSKAFCSDKRAGKKATKKALRDLREKGLLLSKRGANNKKLYCVNDYILENPIQDALSPFEFSGIEEFIQDTIALDLVGEVAKEINNNASYRRSMLI